jgi:hypothetical protein
MKNEKGTSQLNDANAPPRTPKNDFVIVPNSIIPQNSDLSTELLKIHRVMATISFAKTVKACRILPIEGEKVEHRYSK